LGIRLPRVVAAALAGACALGLASCGSPKYEYLQDSDVGAYFKVPHGWTVIDEDQLLANDPSLTPTQREARKQTGWSVVASGRLIHQSDGSVAPDPDRPWVSVDVFALNQQGHDVMSNQLMENLVTDLSQVPADQYTLLGTQSVVLDGGYHGVRRAFERRGEDGSYTDHLEQVLTDPATSRLYTLQIVCSPDCFEQYSDEISAVLGSWTIKEP
jgi:hypothetical protein